MLLHIAKIKHQPQAVLNYQLEENLPDSAKNGYNDFKITKPVSITGSVTNQGDGQFLVEGHYQAKVDLVCDRCLSDYELAVDGDIKALFGSGHLSEDGVIEVHEFAGENIDITELLLGEISFLLPMQFLCSEDCQGLCPVCGIDLNKDACTCAEDTIDPRWAELAKIKIKEEE